MPVPTKIRLLLIEDSEHDAELAQIVLERSGYETDATIVHDREGVDNALSRGEFDLILSDFVLPGFSGAEALEISSNLAPHTPFIFFSGVFGETHAVEMMRAGATDYVLKQNLALLPKAVARALAEVHERRERERVQARLDALELRSRLAIDASRLGMWELDPITRSLNWDARCSELVGMSKRKSVSLGEYLDRVHPHDRASMLAALERAMTNAADSDYHEEYRVLLPDGSVRWLSARGRALFRSGTCIRFLGVLMDITAEKRVTEALEEQNERLGESVQARTRERDRTWDVSRDLLAVCDSDTRIVALNPAWEQTLGWARKDLLGRPLVDFCMDEDRDHLSRLATRDADDEDTYRRVSRMRHANGEWRWISWTTVIDNDMAYVAGRDITDDIAVVDELAATNRKLREQIAERERVETTLRQMQRFEAIGQLTAGVAHDFNNLLLVILSNAGLLERELELDADSVARQRLDNIRSAGERGAKVTGQLLAFSRRQQLEPKEVDLNVTIASMLQLLQSTLGSSIRIETALEAGLNSALADPTQLELIILNLAINARDAMPHGGTLRLRTQNCRLSKPPRRLEEPEPGDYVALSVEDTGTGMSADVLAKAFEPFFTTKEVGKGSGLGLPQVFGFAKQTGGGAVIESQAGRGTSVTVYLPRLQELDRRIGLAQESGSDVSQQPPAVTVLLVDDDPGVREVTCIMLEDLGYRVLQADSGKAALEFLRGDHVIDVLLTDFAMPEMNGAELASAARECRPDLPIVFVTGYAELDALDMDDAQLLQKPFRERELSDRIERACAR